MVLILVDFIDFIVNQRCESELSVEAFVNGKLHATFSSSYMHIGDNPCLQFVAKS